MTAPALGYIWPHLINHRILFCYYGEYRNVKILKSSNSPTSKTAQFVIVTDGFREIKAKK